MNSDTRFVVEGSRVTDIPSFYAELTRVLMPHEEWTLGSSLDALDDLLYGGIGNLVGVAHPVIVLRDHARIREALGMAATRDYYLAKTARPDLFDAARFRTAIDELDAGRGVTYFDLVLGVFEDHPNVGLILA